MRTGCKRSGCIKKVGTLHITAKVVDTFFRRFPKKQSFLTILSFVRSGLASSVLNWIGVRHLWKDGIVNVRKIVEPELIRVISIASPVNRPLSIAAKAVYEILQDIVVSFAKKGEWKGRLIRRE